MYPEGLTECAAINARILFRMANLPNRPARRRAGDEIEGSFRDQGFMETLELLDMWPPEYIRERYFSLA